MPPAIRKGKRTEVEAGPGEASDTRDHTRTRTNSVASVPGAFEDEVGDQTVIGPESAFGQGILGETKQPDDELQRIKTIAFRYRAERNVDRDRAIAFEEELAHSNAELLKLRETIRMLQARGLQPTVQDPVEEECRALDTSLNEILKSRQSQDTDKGKRPERPQPLQNRELPLYTARDISAASGISGPPDSLTVNWRPRGRDPKEPLKGESPDEYPPWRYAVLLKLKTDAPLFPDDDTKIGYALSQMKQPIFDDMFSWVFDRGDSVTLHDLFDEIEHYLGCHLQEREARKELISIAQRPNEPISEYYHRICKLWQKAKTTETERVEKLLTTMLPSLSAPLIAREYKRTRELLDDARTVEDRKKDVAFSHPRNKVRVTPTANNARDPLPRPSFQQHSRSTSSRTATPPAELTAAVTRNSRFGPVARKPDGWTGTWHDPVPKPKKIDTDEKALMTKQGRCWTCRGSGHRSHDTCCPNYRAREKQFHALDTTETLQESDSGNE